LREKIYSRRGRKTSSSAIEIEAGGIMNNNDVGIIIVVAGLSSRMGEFKPLMRFKDKTIIEHVVDTAIDSGAGEVIVVVGKEKEKIKKQLSGRNISIVENPDYADSEMLQSIKCGIERLSENAKACFVMPGDMPLISKACYRCMLNKAKKTKDIKVVQIKYHGNGGHPILVKKECFSHILNYEGDNGLKGALKKYKENIGVLEWHNSTILMDVDTPEDYQLLERIYDRKEIPSKAEVFTLINKNQLDPKIIAHCIAVEKVAINITDKAIRSGYKINTNLVSAAALLHDIERGKPNHAKAGADLMRELGYYKVAKIIEEHMFLSKEADNHIDERAVVFLADKLVIEDKMVGIRKRFEKQLLKYENTPEIYKKIEDNMMTAIRLKEILM